MGNNVCVLVNSRLFDRAKESLPLVDTDCQIQLLDEQIVSERNPLSSEVSIKVRYCEIGRL